MKTKYFFIISLLFFVIRLPGQDIRFDHLTINEGLSQSSVFYIHQCHQGLMWFATEDGLNRYNGYDFTVFKQNENNQGSITDNYITGITETSDNTLWIATRGGLSRYDYNTNSFRNYTHNDNKPQSIVSNYLMNIIEDNNGNLWIGTESGLSCLRKENRDKGIFTNYTTNGENSENGLNNDYIRALHYDKKGRIWIGTQGGGLNCLLPETGEFFHFTHSAGDSLSIIHNTVYCLETDRDGNLWIGTKKGIGLLRLSDLSEKKTQNAKFEIFTPQNGEIQINEMLIHDIENDSEGNIWIATNDNGIFKYEPDKNSVSHYKNRPELQQSLINNRVFNIYEDDANVMWFGTSGGISKFDKRKQKFKHYTYLPNTENTMPHSFVWAINQDDSGNLWIATQAGLAQLNRQTNQYTSFVSSPGNKNTINASSIKAILKGDENTFWLGTYRGGLDKLRIEDKHGVKNYRFTHYTTKNLPPNSLCDDLIWSLAKDKNGIIWIGTNDGLSRFNPATNQFDCYKHNPDDSTSLAYIEAYTLLVDHQNTLWVGTDQGLDRFIPGREEFAHYQNDPANKNSLNSNSIMSVYEDSKGVFWVGTTAGLNKVRFKNTPDYEIDTVIRYSKKNGLPNEMIYGILEDSHNNLWISTNNGLSKFNPEKETFKNYTVEDGLQSNEFNAGAYFKNREGEMFFGGINGFNSFFPDSVSDNKYEPQVLFTDFKLFNKSVPIGEMSSGRTLLSKHISQTREIVLSYKDYVLSFEFASLHFAAPDENEYAYIMENFEEKWNYIGTRRFCTYTSLPAGEYTLKVKATNSDGVWSSKTTQVHIIVKPPFWETWWFRLLVILSVGGIVTLWYRWRLNRIKKQKDELEKQVELRTAEVVEQKNKIQRAYENVKELSEIGHKVTMHLSVERIIETVFENIVDLMDASVFSIGIYNPDEQTLDFAGVKENYKTIPFYQIDLSLHKKSLAAWCFTNRKEVFIQHFSEEYTKYIPEYKKPEGITAAESVLYCPLEVKEKYIGVISVQSLKREVYTEYHLNILRNLAVYTAIALDNAEAYNQIDQHAAKLKEANVQLEEQQEEIQQQAEELSAQAEELKATNAALQHEKEYTMGSIRYAKTIQNAILPSTQQIKKLFDAFIIFRAKDIVSGDFYWISHFEPDTPNEKIFIAVVDCTGHGVPGAFMSMIGNRMLSEIVNEMKIFDPKDVLKKLDKEIKIALKQESSDNSDGMDLALCRIERKNNEYGITFSGAKRPLLYYQRRSGKIEMVRGNRRSIGGLRLMKKEIPFTNSKITLTKGDIIYLYSDGIIDQNAPDRRRFGTPRFLELLNNTVKKPIMEQKADIENELDDYQAEELQRDDITILGIRLK